MHGYWLNLKENWISLSSKSIKPENKNVSRRPRWSAVTPGPHQTVLLQAEAINVESTQLYDKAIWFIEAKR